MRSLLVYDCKGIADTKMHFASDADVLNGSDISPFWLEKLLKSLQNALTTEE